MAAYGTIAGVSTERYELLSGGAELVNLSLLAARTAVVLRQLSQSGDLGVGDDDTLNAMGQVLADAAHAVQFFGSGGRRGPRPAPHWRRRWTPRSMQFFMNQCNRLTPRRFLKDSCNCRSVSGPR